jgi:hypothetical protein
MRAFEVYVNRRRLCVAGIGDDGVLSAIVSLITRKREGDLFLEVGDLISPTKEHVIWSQQKPLRIGDEILVKIVERTAIDEPADRHKPDSRKQLASEKAYVRAMAKKHGWTLKTPSQLKK